MIVNSTKIIVTLLLLTTAITPAAEPKQVSDYDVVVVGGTPAGAVSYTHLTLPTILLV